MVWGSHWMECHLVHDFDYDSRLHDREMERTGDPTSKSTLFGARYAVSSRVICVVMQRRKNIVTRLATAQDIPALIDLWQQFMRGEQEVISHANPDKAIKNWTVRLQSQVEKSQVLLAACNNIPVGFVGFIDSTILNWIPKSIAYVVDIYVLPEARPSSAARMLFKLLMDHASLRYAEVWTNTSVQNRRVQVLLTRAGFLPLDDFKIPGLEGQLYFKKKTIA